MELACALNATPLDQGLGYRVRLPFPAHEALLDGPRTAQVKAFLRGNYVPMGDGFINPTGICDVLRLDHRGLAVRWTRDIQVYDQPVSRSEMTQLITRAGLCQVEHDRFISLSQTLCYSESSHRGITLRSGFPVDRIHRKRFSAAIASADWAGLQDGRWTNPEHAVLIHQGHVAYRGGHHHPLTELTPAGCRRLDRVDWFALPDCQINLAAVIRITAGKSSRACLPDGESVPIPTRLVPRLRKALASPAPSDHHGRSSNSRR
jgi:hypothetical protein